MALHGTVRFGTSSFPYPASISGKKVLDQNGDVFAAFNMSSWGITTNLSDADITTAVAATAANGFTSMVAWIGGGYEIGAAPTGWNVYTTVDHGNMWSGTPWASTLSTGWLAVDHFVDQCAANNIVPFLSFCGGNGDTGAADDWAAVTNTNMQTAGTAIANRYLSRPYICWHIMLDSVTTPGDTRGQRIDALFAGINSVEGTSMRPVRWMEVDNGATTSEQGWYDPTGATTNFRCSVNSVYEYGGSSVELWDTEYSEESGPVADCEPRYVGNSYTTGNTGQQFRERNYTVFIRGGWLINFGHEDWWTFGADGLFSDGETWDTVQADTEVVQASYAWSLLATYVKDTTWAPTSAFVTTGEGTGDTKAAQGASDTAALAYFPDNRTVAVDTTILTGTANVRLRWYDPTAGTFSTIAASEAQQTGRSVTLPAAHGDGTRDFVLVVDLA